MTSPALSLRLLEDRYAICRLDGHGPVPTWAMTGPFCSVTRTPDELSIVCLQEAVPGGIVCERDWCCLGVIGPLDFALVGVLASLAAPLAEGGISLFAVSTFDTDYLLVKARDLEKAIGVLEERGHSIER